MLQANFNAIDGAATPITHTFKAMGATLQFAKDGSTTAMAVWKDFDSGTDTGRKTLVHRFAAPPMQSVSGFVKQSMTLKVPKVNTVGISDSGITPAISMAYFNQYVYTQNVSVRAPANDLNNEVVLFRNILSVFGSSGAGVGTAALTLNEAIT